MEKEDGKMRRRYQLGYLSLDLVGDKEMLELAG